VTESDPASWTDLIRESVHTNDDEHLGDIEAVNRNFMVVRKGLVNVRRFYVPLTKVHGWDGKAVWLNISERDASENYQKDRRPDPHDYYFSSAQPTEPANFVRDFQINMPKIVRTYEEERPFATASNEPRHERNSFSCDLCESKFRTESELDDHITARH
jgi:hypothetical protein